MDEKTYKSAIDLWICLLIGGAAAACALGAFTLITADVTGGRFLAGALVLLGSGLPLWFMFSTRYVLDKSTLKVKSGPLTWNVPLSSIHNVARTRNPLSSPAFSLKRLRIDYDRMNSIMISPQDEAKFLQDLQERVTKLGGKADFYPNGGTLRSRTSGGHKVGPRGWADPKKT